jgi:hypothetical protein
VVKDKQGSSRLLNKRAGDLRCTAKPVHAGNRGWSQHATLLAWDNAVCQSAAEPKAHTGANTPMRWATNIQRLKLHGMVCIHSSHHKPTGITPLGKSLGKAANDHGCTNHTSRPAQA